MTWLKLPDINGLIITLNIELISAIWPGRKEKKTSIVTISGKEKNGQIEYEDDNTRCNILMSGYVICVMCSTALVQTLVAQALSQKDKDVPIPIQTIT